MKMHTAQHYEMNQLFIKTRVFRAINEVTLGPDRNSGNLSERAECLDRKFLGPKFRSPVSESEVAGECSSHATPTPTPSDK